MLVARQDDDDDDNVIKNISGHFFTRFKKRKLQKITQKMKMDKTVNHVIE